MGLIDFILNLAGLLLWLDWRAVPAGSPGGRKPVTLLGTLRQAKPGGAGTRWPSLALLAALLLLRAVFYWQIGPAAHWAAKLNLGVIELSFRSDFFTRMLLFSFCSFALTLAVFYLWLILFSILAGPEPIQSFVRAQLGSIDRWRRGAKLLLPLPAAAFLGWLALWPLAWLHIAPLPASMFHHLAAALLLGLESYLAWTFPAALLLLLHLANNYVYFGQHPFWNYVDATAQTLLAPLKTLPLRAGKVNLAPLAGLALVFLLAELAGRLLDFLYARLAV